MSWSCWLVRVFYRGLMSLPVGYFNSQVVGITCSLLWIACSIVDSMCLFNTESKDSCSVTSSPFCTVCIWRLPLIGGKTSGCRVRQVCVGIPLCHFLAFELSHWHGCSGTSPWPLVNVHYLFLAGGYDYDACGYSHFLLLLAILCLHGLEHWLCSERAIWSLDMFLTSGQLK